jgi:hypothetical protein
MKFSFSVEYSTEGAPIFIGDLESAQQWNGRQHDGAGITLEYFGRGLETFPKEFAQSKKQGGMRKKTFKNPDELATFESELLKRFMKLHPTAAKPAKYPNYPAYYVGDKRAFGMERRFTSAFTTMLKKLNSDVAVVPFSGKPKAQALFFDTEGGGPGVIASDPSAGAFVATRILTTGDPDHADLLFDLEQVTLSKLRPRGRLKLEDLVVIFDSSSSSSDVAQYNWGTQNLREALRRAVQANPCGPIMMPDQVPPGGAYLRVSPGVHNYALVRDRRTKTVAYTALWLWLS